MVQRGRKSAAQLSLLHLTSPDPSVTQPHSAPPPSHLSKDAVALWNEFIKQADDLAPHHFKLLEAACGSWDRMQQARKALAAGGLSYTDGKGLNRPRPEIAIERNAAITFARLIRELRLATTPPKKKHVGGIGWLGPDHD